MSNQTSVRSFIFPVSGLPVTYADLFRDILSGAKQHGCRACWACVRLRYEFDVALLVVRMCRDWDPWVRVKWSNARKTWKQLWWNSWIARCRKFRMGLRYAGRQWRRLERWWILVFSRKQTKGLTAEMHDPSGASWWTSSMESSSSCQETCRVQRTIRTWRSMHSLEVCSYMSSWSCCAREETGIVSQMIYETGVRRRDDFFFRRVPSRTIQVW